MHAPTKDGISPLWIAAQFGNIEVIKLLLKHGAKPDQMREVTNPLEHSHAGRVSTFALVLAPQLTCRRTRAGRNHAIAHCQRKGAY